MNPIRKAIMMEGLRILASDTDDERQEIVLNMLTALTEGVKLMVDTLMHGENDASKLAMATGVFEHCWPEPGTVSDKARGSIATAHAMARADAVPGACSSQGGDA